MKLNALAVNDPIPTAEVDVVRMIPGDRFASFQENRDFASVLKECKKAVVFSLPGAFNPLCSARHLPGFIKLEVELSKKGVDGIFCLSVNDKFVLKAWGESTDGWKQSSVKLIADGNAEIAKAVGYTKDVSRVRMGIRSRRWAAIVEQGIVKWFELDDIGICERASAENVLRNL